MRRYLAALTLPRLVALIACLGIFVMAVRAPLDTDMFWHLRAGQWQVEHRALLRVDHFSHTRAGETWINHSWLSQVIVYEMYAVLGDAGLALYTALLATVGMVFVYRQTTGDPFVRAFTLVLAAAASAVFWSPRPQMMSFVMSTVVLYLLWLYREKNVDRLWLIPPIMALWANLHGGFAIGFILMVLVVLGESVCWFFDDFLRPAADLGERPTLHHALRLVVIGLVSAAAVSLNPYGPSMLLYPFRTVGIGVLRDFIQEWASPNFHAPQTWPFVWLLLATLAAVGLSSRRLDWRDAILVTGTAYSALLAGRNIATFAIVAAPVLTIHLGDWLNERGYRLKWERVPTGGVFTAINWVLLVVLILAGVVKATYALSPKLIEAARADALPIDAVMYLEETRPPGPLFNSYNWGGYLIWAARSYPVYVDGRTDLYDDELLRVYLATSFAQPGWCANLDAAGINVVLIERNSPLAQVLSLVEGWKVTYQDERAVILVREVPLGNE